MRGQRAHPGTEVPPPAPGAARSDRWTIRLGAALCVVSVLSPGVADHLREPRVSGAYRALNEWAASRSYPERDLPAAAFARAYRHARQLRGAPEADGGGPEDAAEWAATTGAGWRPLGPTNGGGRTLALAIDPLDPDVVYAGSASGGLWRTTTGGVGAAAWQRVATGHPVLGVGAIALPPGQSEVIYIGTGEVYNVVKTGDLAADRATRGSYGIGILKSGDGGATWAASLDWSDDPRHGVWAIRIDPADPRVVWAATTRGVYKSTDAGASWSQKHAVVMATDLVLHPIEPGTALVACGNLSSPGRGLYRTTDGGDSWTQITGGGIPADFAGKIQLGVTAADPNLVFASIGNGFQVSGTDNATWLLRSTDFGATWTLRTTTDFSRWQGWFAHDVAVHPQDPEIVICVGIDAWKSTDGGATLAQKSDYRAYHRGNLPPGGPEGAANYSHADHHDVVFHPARPGVVYFANDGGVFRSLDGGETFAGVNGGYQSGQFYNGFVSDPSDPNLAMGGLQDFGSAIYRGNGQWTRWVLGGDGGWCAIDPGNGNTVYATAQWLYVARSSNGGASFTNITPYPWLGGPVAFIAPLLMSPTNAEVLYAGSSYLFKTFNGGGLWYVGQQGNPIDGNPILLLATPRHNDAVVYLATAPHIGRGRVHRSRNGGASFTDITGALPDRFPGDLAVDPTNEAVVYLALSGFGTSHVFRSSDYGATWVDLDGGRLPDVPATAVVVDPGQPNHVYVGNDLGVFLTVNDGASWVQLAGGLPEAVLVADLSISLADGKLRVATHGNGVYERDLIAGPLAAVPPAVPGTSVHLRAAGPSPFAAATTLRLELPVATEVSLAVHDVCGRRVRALAGGARPAGRHDVVWDGRDDRGRRLPAGTYFCRLVAAGEVRRVPVVLLR